MRFVLPLHQKVSSSIHHPVISSGSIDRHFLIADIKLPTFIFLYGIHQHLQFHFLSALLIRESGLLAVFALVSLFFIPHIREQKDLRLAARFPDGFDSVTAILSLLPGLALLYAATPLAVKPPSRDL
jgi:hypothetical protein